MAAKTGTTGAAAPEPTDPWAMAYNPDIVIGSWVGRTGANGQGRTITSYGEAVGDMLMAEFVNSLPSSFHDWYQQPAGLVASKRTGDPLLPGTENLPTCSGAGGGGEGGGGGKHGKP